MKQRINFKWVLRVVVLSFVISVVFTLASGEVLEDSGYITAFLVLALFIVINVLFDIVGTAVTSAVPKPFHSMAAHKETGAIEALRLLKSAEKVANFCNDIVGDITGIVSGATSAVIAARIMANRGTESVIWSLLVSGVVASLTIGGKAIGKTVAMNNSTKIILTVGKAVHLKTRLTSRKKKG